jgi:hypothetical protein
VVGEEGRDRIGEIGIVADRKDILGWSTYDILNRTLGDCAPHKRCLSSELLALSRDDGSWSLRRRRFDGGEWTRGVEDGKTEIAARWPARLKR